MGEGIALHLCRREGFRPNDRRSMRLQNGCMHRALSTWQQGARVRHKKKRPINTDSLRPPLIIYTMCDAFSLGTAAVSLREVFSFLFLRSGQMMELYGAAEAYGSAAIASSSAALRRLPVDMPPSARPPRSSCGPHTFSTDKTTR